MEFVSISVTTHIYAILALFFVMVYNFINILKEDDFLSLVKKLRITTPLFHMANAIVAYTGGIVAAFTHDISITVALMIATSIFVMVLEIKRYKKQRVIKSKEYDKQNEFKLYAKKLYTMQIGALTFTYIISKLV